MSKVQEALGLLNSMVRSGEDHSEQSEAVFRAAMDHVNGPEGGLTLDEQATNYETYVHINNVMRLLSNMQAQLAERMFSHDRSKLAPPEVDTFTEYTAKLKGSTYGSDEYKQFLVEMKPALDHHYANNRHHPEFFPNGIEQMNLIDVLEMLCDWKAASMRHADGDIRKSIEINRERFGLAEQLVNILHNTVPLLEL